ncbi:unnamed protein product [Sphenostylis stenocarpa]|uniref:Uncharacterized protein n=1 Tax=Sphenostylis stenocarpa TaxID=92480 RepID=A0AA86VDF2_9FABA|nr:unnamed protein product [Sphenostylis stenocarpa]
MEAVTRRRWNLPKPGQQQRIALQRGNAYPLVGFQIEEQSRRSPQKIPKLASWNTEKTRIIMGLLFCFYGSEFQCLDPSSGFSYLFMTTLSTMREGSLLSLLVCCPSHLSGVWNF